MPDSRPVTNRLRDGVLYFPTKAGITYLIKAAGGSIHINKKPTCSIASDIKRCYFQETHLMEVDITEEYINKLNNISQDPKFVEARRATDKRLMFDMLCPGLSSFVESCFSPYKYELTIAKVSDNLLNLMLLTCLKSLNHRYNENNVLQKIVCLIGGGRTGKSQLGNLFTLLSLNNSQSCEMRHLHSRFESVAWANRSLLTFPDISKADLRGRR